MNIGFTRMLLIGVAVQLFIVSPASTQLVKLKAAYSVQSSWSLATWVGYEAGLFKKYGLDVDLVLIRATPIVTTAMISGEAPIGQLGGNGPIAAALQGADTVNFATLVNLIPQSFVVTPEIKTPDDLKGKRYGVSRFGAISDVVVRRYLRRFGIDPERDVQIIQIGGIPELLTAMKAGAISGGSMSPPVLGAAKKAGFKELVDFETLDYKYPATALATTRSFIQRQRSTVLNFLRGEIEAAHAISKQKEFSIKVLKKYMRIDDAEVLDEGYRYAVRFIQTRPFPTIEETRAVLDELKRPAAKPESFLDLSLLQELEIEKFFDKLR
jgi:NitT/TauT family transport system substrate-binding protein